MKLAIRLNPADNVAVAMEDLGAGEHLSVLSERGVEVDRVVVMAPVAPLYHKVALAQVDPGAAVIKYGETIGYATAPIRRGDWVHMHNLISPSAAELERSGGAR